MLARVVFPATIADARSILATGAVVDDPQAMRLLEQDGIRPITRMMPVRGVEPPPAGPFERAAQVTLSEQRVIQVSLQFNSLGAELQVNRVNAARHLLNGLRVIAHFLVGQPPQIADRIVANHIVEAGSQDIEGIQMTQRT